jgi:hypothetical protein
MSELGERIRRSVDEVAPPIDVELIVDARAHQHPKSSPHRALVAGGVALAVSMAIWAVGALVGADVPQPIIGPAPSDLAPTGPVWPASAPAPPATQVDGSTRFAWQRLQLPDGAGGVIDGGDRILADTAATLKRSFDGVAWSDVWPELSAADRRRTAGEVLSLSDPVAWQDTIAGLLSGHEGRVVRVIDADGQVNRHVFERQVTGLGIGPGGVVASAAVNAPLDDVVRDLLGPRWALPNLRSAHVRDDLLVVVDQHGREATADLREEGLDPAALAGPYGWYAAPGAPWLPVEGYLGPVDRIVGTRRGFFAVASQSVDAHGVWFSSDGTAWEHIPLPHEMTDGGVHTVRTLGRWKGGALVSVRPVDGTATTFAEVGPQGARTLFTADLASPALPPRSTAVASGALGILVAGVDERGLYSPTGEEPRPLNPPSDFSMPPEERWPFWPNAIVTGNVAIVAGGDLDDDFVSQWWRLTPTDQP